MKHIIPVGLLFSLAHMATAASYTVYSGDAVDVTFGGEVQFHMPKFDTGLGTLTGVTVKMMESNLTGSFEITNNSISAMTVDLVTSHYRVRQVTSALLDYRTQTLEIDPLVISPDSNPSVFIANGDFQVFTINPSLRYSISDQNIAAEYFEP